MMHPLLEISKTGILPTVSFKDVESAVKTVKALDLHGINVIEVMLRSNASIDAIKAIKESYPSFIVGAGTIKSIEDVERTLEAGASFFVLPYWDEAVVDYCIKKNLPVVPAVSSAKEIALAEKLGLDCVKFFPAESLGGVNALELYSGAFRTMKFIPTGGITQDNFKSYLNFPCVTAVGGGFMLDKSALENKDFIKVSESVGQTILKQFNFRTKHVGINMDSENDAFSLAGQMASLFGKTIRNGSKSVMVGSDVEVMKFNYHGDKGHIGIASDDVDRAYHYLSKRGVTFIEDTVAYDSHGKIKVAYLKESFGGFAIHLMR